MRRSRRNHTAAFTANVAVAAVKDDTTLTELAETFDLPATQIAHWRTQVSEAATGVFLSPAERRENTGPSVKDRQATIGQLARVNECVAVALGRVDEESVKT